MVLACVANVSVGFSTRSRHFSLFGGAKIGAHPTLMARAGRGSKPHDFEKGPFDTFAVG